MMLKCHLKSHSMRCHVCDSFLRSRSAGSACFAASPLFSLLCVVKNWTLLTSNWLAKSLITQILLRVWFKRHRIFPNCAFSKVEHWNAASRSTITLEESAAFKSLRLSSHQTSVRLKGRRRVSTFMGTHIFTTCKVAGSADFSVL